MERLDPEVTIWVFILGTTVGLALIVIVDAGSAVEVGIDEEDDSEDSEVEDLDEVVDSGGCGDVSALLRDVFACSSPKFNKLAGSEQHPFRTRFLSQHQLP